MPRPRKAAVAAPADAAPTTPFVIDPNAVYRPPQLRTLLGLREYSLAREIRSGRLRVGRRCGRYYCIGRWVLDWLESAPGAKPLRRETQTPN